MKISNEIKVGLTIIVATVIFILGIRYFEDLPLFDSTYDLVAEFENAGGLMFWHPGAGYPSYFFVDEVTLE